MAGLEIRSPTISPTVFSYILSDVDRHTNLDTAWLLMPSEMGLIRTRKRATKAVALAEQMGHSTRVLLSTYAHAIDRECLFVDIGQIQSS